MNDTVYILFEDGEILSVYANAEDAEQAWISYEADRTTTEYYVESYGVIS